MSDKISVRRSLPDTRHSECRKLDYGDPSALPKASVILIFCNETMSALMRTVWSVIDQSPPDLLHEIVLIDDGSGTEEITVLLPEYIKYRLNGYNVHLHRYEKQGGLIFARQEGEAQFYRDCRYNIPQLGFFSQVPNTRPVTC